MSNKILMQLSWEEKPRTKIFMLFMLLEDLNVFDY